MTSKREATAVMTYHKEGPACGKILMILQAAKANCECPDYYEKEKGGAQ